MNDVCTVSVWNCGESCNIEWGNDYLIEDCGFGWFNDQGLKMALSACGVTYYKIQLFTGGGADDPFLVWNVPIEFEPGLDRVVDAIKAFKNTVKFIDPSFKEEVE